MPSERSHPPIYFAHDHMDKPADFARDLNGGVTGKILHMVCDGWLGAPTREEFEASYYGSHWLGTFAIKYLLTLQ